MRIGSKKEGKQYKGIREGGINDNTAFYVFTHAAVSQKPKEEKTKEINKTLNKKIRKKENKEKNKEGR